MLAMWNPPAALSLTLDQRQTLQTWVNARNTPEKIVFRARLILLASEGRANLQIARTLGTSRPTVVLWRHRFAQGGPQALLQDAPGRGRKVRIGAEKVQAIIDATLQTKPVTTTHWSVRTMARSQGVSPTTVQRSGCR